MQINKKVITTAITALLLLSIVASVAPAFAVDTFGASIVTPAVATGPVGTKTTITVTGASPGGQILVYWENTGGAVISNTTSYADGTGNAAVKVTVPAAATNGAHLMIVKDVAYGVQVSVSFNIEAKITLSPKSGLPGDQVTVTGSGFTAGKTIALDFDGVNVTPTTAPKVASDGSFTAYFNVPDSKTTYQNYVVTATESATVFATATFKVGASIILDKTAGGSGTVVTVTGRGFTASSAISIKVNGVTAPLVSPITATTSGTISGQFIVPTLPLSYEWLFDVVASDSAVPAITATATFDVTGTTTITVPSSSYPSAAITITGANFTHIAGTAVTVTFGTTSPGAFTIGTFTTDADGSISGTVNIPSLPTGNYIITAKDAKGLIVQKTIILAITNLVVTPDVAPTGTVVHVVGYGFTVGDTFNVTFASVTVVTEAQSGTVQAGGMLTADFVIPTINPNKYSVIVTDHTGLRAETTLTVNATSQLIVNPTTAPLDQDVAITAHYFGSASQLNFYLSNSSKTIPLTVTPSTTTLANGTLFGTFEITSGMNLAFGTYTVIANSTNGLFNATTTFTFGAPTFIVSTRASSYSQGDTVSFKVQSSYMGYVIITMVDPQGTPAYTLVQLSQVPVNGYYVGVYSIISEFNGFKLPSDAVLGKWCWNASLNGDFDVVNVALPTAVVEAAPLMATVAPATGEFTVTPSISSTVNKISDTVTSTGKVVNSTAAIIAQILGNVTGTKDAITSISNGILTIQTSTSQISSIQSAISNLPSSISSSVSSSIQTSITNGLATISTKLDSIDAVIGNVAGNVVTLKTSIGDVTTSLTALNAKVVSIEGNVATIVTDVGVIQGTVSSIKDGVATIQTGVGTIQTSVNGLQPEVKAASDNSASVSTMVYVAVAFALIAAIAAVASILLMRKKIAS